MGRYRLFPPLATGTGRQRQHEGPGPSDSPGPGPAAAALGPEGPSRHSARPLTSKEARGAGRQVRPATSKPGSLSVGLLD